MGRHSTGEVKNDNRAVQEDVGLLNDESVAGERREQSEEEIVNVDDMPDFSEDEEMAGGKREKISRNKMRALTAVASVFFGLVLGAASVETSIFPQSLFDSLSASAMSDNGVDIVIKDGGKERHISVASYTVGEALKEAGVSLGEHDRLSTATSSPVLEGLQVSITRLEMREETIDETVPFETIRNDDADVLKGMEKVVQSGREGLIRSTYHVFYTASGEEFDRRVVNREVVTEKVDKVVAVGTKEGVPGGYYTPNPNGHLTRSSGTFNGPSGKETYYNLPMSGVVSIAKGAGIPGDYWVRDDGVKMYGDHIMLACAYSIRPRGTLVQTSLGMGICLDTGTFAYSNPTQVDIAVNW